METKQVTAIEPKPKSRTQEKRERNEMKREQRNKRPQYIPIWDDKGRFVDFKVIYHVDNSRQSGDRKRLWDMLNTMPKPNSKSFARKQEKNRNTSAKSEAKVIVANEPKAKKPTLIGRVKKLFNRKAS